MHRAPLPAVALILSAGYALSIARGLTWANFGADGGDLITAAATGGVPHPTGYPLYLLLARGFQYIPIGNMAFRTNLLAAVCTVLTAMLLYVHLSRQFTQAISGWIPAFLAALAYGLAPFVWGQASITEVYALHGLLLMLCVCVWSRSSTHISEWMCGLVFGVATTNHLTAILMSPLLLFGVDGRLFISRHALLRRCVGVVCGLSIYLILPIRAAGYPPVNWGNASSLQGFLWLVSGQPYRAYLFSLPLGDMLDRLRAFTGLMLEQYTWLGVLLGLYGLISLRGRRALLPTLWMALAFLAFAVSYGSKDSQVNLLAVWLAFAIWIAYGLQDLLASLSNRAWLRWSAWGLLFLALVVRAVFIYPSVDASHDARAEQYINRTLAAVPRDSLMFAGDDERVFALWYAQFALHQRLDTVIVAEGLLPYDWYRQHLRHTYPGLKIREGVRLHPSDLVALNQNRPACYVSYEPVICTNR